MPDPTLRMSEVYLSTQGEGPRVGFPTVFVRFAGCNLRCPGWPCDTPFAIFPEQYRKEWKTFSPGQVYDDILRVANGVTRVNVCYTGGEPFLQNYQALLELSDLLWEKNDSPCAVVECFSNGTLVYPNWAIGTVSFIMDWKLPGSGEDPDNENRFKNLEMLTGHDVVKFTIADRTDYQLAKNLYYEFIEPLGVPVFYGVAWGKLEPKELVAWVLEDGLDWRLNMQVHNIIWPRDQRGT